MKLFKSKFLYLLILSIFIFTNFSMEVNALEVPNAPSIKTIHSYKAKIFGQPSTFKVYLDGYNSDYLKVKKAGYSFRTKVYIFEDDKILLQPEYKDYMTEIEIKTAQEIDLSKRYSVQIEFIAFDEEKNVKVDSKKSERMPFRFATSIESSDKKEEQDISKIYIKAPKILEVKESKRAVNEYKVLLEDYNKIYSEIKNNGNFVGEIFLLERYQNASKVIMKKDFYDHDVEQFIQFNKSAFDPNKEYIVVARFTSQEHKEKTSGMASNEIIVKPNKNRNYYTSKYDAKYITRETKAFLFPNEDGLVEPDRNITRGEVAQAFFSVLNPTSVKDYFSNSHDFNDIVPAKYNDAISTMAKMRMIGGYTDGSFKADNPITRAEFISIAMKFYDVDVKNPTNFKDVDPNFWAKQSIDKAVTVGLLNGYSDGTFKPNNPITRAEAAKVINRMTGRVGIENQTKNKYVDNSPSRWYYEEIKVAN